MKASHACWQSVEEGPSLAAAAGVANKAREKTTKANIADREIMFLIGLVDGMYTDVVR